MMNLRSHGCEKHQGRLPGFGKKRSIPQPSLNQCAVRTFDNFGDAPQDSRKPEISSEISLFIRPPRNNDDYRDRDLDCQEAIEHEFLQAVHSSGTPFVDLAKIRTAISVHAVPLGWSAEELEAAMLELVRCYMLRVQQVRNADLAASSPARH